MKSIDNVIEQEGFDTLYDFVTKTKEGQYSQDEIPVQCRIEYEDYSLVQNDMPNNDNILFFGLSY